MRLFSARVFLSFCGCLIVARGVLSKEKLTFKAPSLSDEESHSRFLPDNFRCDACQAIAHQFYTKFNEYNALHKHFKYRLPESELLDLFENICNVETFQGYGVKVIDGTNRLTGPGIDTEDIPGMIAGGGKWPGRLAEMCSSLVEILGEEIIYLSFENSPNDKWKLQDLMCYNGSGVTRACPASQNNRIEL